MLKSYRIFALIIALLGIALALPQRSTQAEALYFTQIGISWEADFSPYGCGLLNDGTIRCWNGSNPGYDGGEEGVTYQQIAQGADHHCALRADDTIYCVRTGGIDLGQANPPTGTFKQIETRHNHGCGIRTDDTLACWGWDQYGQVSNTPTTGTYSKVSAGWGTSCAISATDQTLSCWGYAGDFGDPLTEPPAGTFTDVAVSGNAVCAVSTFGNLTCWGWDWASIISNAPTGINFAEIDAGRTNFCVRTTGGTVTCWGLYMTTGYTPDGTYTQVSSGQSNGCGIRNDNTYACWNGALTYLPRGSVEFSFTETDSTVDETMGNAVEVTMTISYNPVTAELAVEVLPGHIADTATLDEDYTVTTPVTFDCSSGCLPGEYTALVATVIDDELDDDAETATFTLTNPTSTDMDLTPTLGTNTVHVLTITDDDTTPVALDDSYNVLQGATLDVPALTGVLLNDDDADGDDLSVILDTDVSQGILSLNADGSFSYTANWDATGTDSFTYTASDGFQGASATVTLNIEVQLERPVRLYPEDGAVITEGWTNFQFEPYPSAEWYWVWIGDDPTNNYQNYDLFLWFPATDASAGATTGQSVCVDGVCTLPDLWLGNQGYSWWMTYWSPDDGNLSEYWNETLFTVGFDSPATSFNHIAPTDTVNTAPTELVWTSDPATLWYQIWLGTADYTSELYFNWVEAATICDASECRLDVSDLTFADGEYLWWMTAWGPGGNVDWVDATDNPQTFTITTAAAPARE